MLQRRASSALLAGSCFCTALPTRMWHSRSASSSTPGPWRAARVLLSSRTVLKSRRRRGYADPRVAGRQQRGAHAQHVPRRRVPRLAGLDRRGNHCLEGGRRGERDRSEGERDRSPEGRRRGERRRRRQLHAPRPRASEALARAAESTTTAKSPRDARAPALRTCRLLRVSCVFVSSFISHFDTGLRLVRVASAQDACRRERRAASRPWRRREPSPRNIHVAAAASPRPVAATRRRDPSPDVHAGRRRTKVRDSSNHLRSFTHPQASPTTRTPSPSPTCSRRGSRRAG